MKYTISEKQYAALLKEWDVVLPPIAVEPVALAADQVVDWGHQYLVAAQDYAQTRGEGAIIFVLDTGIDDHPDLEANRARKYDKVFTGETGAPGHAHGTHCAGIAAAVDNSTGIIGIAPAAKLVSCRVLNNNGSGSYAWITEAITYVADLILTGEDAGKAKIITMSLGGGSPSSQLEAAINYAISKGVFVVAAAGNSGYNPDRSTVGYPGAYKQVITVAALDPDGDQDKANQKPAGYSSAGDAVDVAAPGSNILSTVLGGGYARFSGTSMATPAVAGVIALLATAFPQVKTQAQMEALLKEFAVDLIDKGFDVRTGAGSPVVSQYLDEKPTPDPDPEPPDPDPEPPKPDPPTKPIQPKRDVTTQLSGWVFYEINGRPDTRRKVYVDLEATLVKTTLFAEDAIDVLRRAGSTYFGRTTIVFAEQADLYAAAYYAAHFFRIWTKIDYKIEPDVGRIVGADEAGRELTLEYRSAVARSARYGPAKSLKSKIKNLILS